MKSKERWTSDNIPDMSGKIVLITGANSGLGFEASRELALKGATVIMACRSVSKGEEAARKITDALSTVETVVMQIDCASLASVRTFAEEFKKRYDHLDILLNNAGVMAPPFSTTEDGFELQIGVNHFASFALTGLLLGHLLQSHSARIVSVSSFAHTMGTINFDDINWRNKYSKWPAYGQSKLANLYLTYELDRRLKGMNARAIAVAAHPGYSRTNLQRHTGLFSFLNHFMAQTSQMGVLPILYAATEWKVGGGQFIGPDGFMEMRGYPKKTNSSKISYDLAISKRFWELSEELTGVKYSFI